MAQEASEKCSKSKSMDYEVLINKYLRGELTKAEKREFDTLMANKEGFAKDVALMLL